MTVDIFTRPTWGSILDPAEAPPLEPPADYVFTMAINRRVPDNLQSCIVGIRETMQHNVTSQNLPDLRYNFIVAASGKIFEGRGWMYRPFLPRFVSDKNSRGFLIGFLGAFKSAIVDMPPPMIEAAEELLKIGIKNGFISKLFIYQDLTGGQVQLQRKMEEMKWQERKISQYKS